MRNATRINSAHTANIATAENRASNFSDDPCRFKGNLIVYGRDFSSIPSANCGEIEGRHRGNLLQRYNSKKTRLVSRSIHQSSSGPSFANAPQNAMPMRYGLRTISRGKILAAIAGCVFVGAAVGRPWELRKEQESSPSPSSTHLQAAVISAQSSMSGVGAISASITPDTESATLAAATKTKTDEINIAALEKRIDESISETAKYRNEAAMLRSQVSSLVDENAALSEETLSLNRELLDLEIMVLALQEQEVSSSDTVTQVVYNFVNVPIGSDPEAVYNEEPGDPASNRRVNNSSYNNSPNLSIGSSETIGELDSGRESRQQYTEEYLDGSSDEYLDSLVDGIIEEHSN